MNAKLRLVSLGFVAAGLLAPASGCKVANCSDGDSSCIQVKSLPRFNGTVIDDKADWASGEALTIESPNGQVVVYADAPSGQVTFKAKPFAYADDEAEAQKTMNGKLSFNPHRADDGGIVLQGSAQGSGMYGLDLEVHVPADFDALLDVEQKNGAVELRGTGPASQTRVISENGSIRATAQTLGQTIYLTTENGSIDVNGSPSGAGNVVHSDNGSVTFGVASNANVTIHAMSSDPVSYPTDWSVVGESAYDVTITVGDGSAELQVSSNNGSVTIQ